MHIQFEGMHMCASDDINANNEVARGIDKARIEGLWWKAQMGYNDQRCDPEVVAKFAELIVKECAMFSMVVTDDHYDVDALYKHFGVDDE